MKYRLHLSYLLIAIFCLLLGGCSGSSSASRKEHSGPPRDSTPKVLTPSADGVNTLGVESLGGPECSFRDAEELPEQPPRRRQNMAISK